MKRMKQSNGMIDRFTISMVTALIMFAVPLFALGTSQSIASADISDEKLEVLARVYLEVYEINQSYKSRIEAADTTEEANQLQQAANQAMLDVIENEDDVTVNEYNDVISALGNDDELRERLQAQVDEIQEEESEQD